MNRRCTLTKSVVGALLALTVPSVALAHVSVRPRESKPDAEEQYTVRVPTEGLVATTHVQLEIPADVTVLEVLPVQEVTFQTARQGDRITSVTWKKEIPLRQAAEFVFRARSPSSTGIVWKAHQHFSDGTTADWVGQPGERRPASVTKLAAAGGVAANQAENEAAAIREWLTGYDAAFNAKDLEKLAGFYHPEVTIFEGGGVNRGWADYRDHHLGPELKQVENLQFSRSNTVVRMLGRDAAYVTSEYSIKARVKDREIDSGGLETLVLVREAGVWKIRHSHTSSRRRPAA